ncbi:MAG: GDSL-type esterase/lipase family protein, partial [Caulobacteraceae bacterium]
AADPALFQGRIVNRGISGQTTAQMVVRFYADVVRLHPRVVHLLGSANDIAGNVGPTTFEYWTNNITAMVELAHANGIIVVLGSLTPTDNLYWRPQPHTAETVGQMNTWLRDFAAISHIRYIDYYTPLVGKDGAFRPDLSNDGVHPNAAGYAIMKQTMMTALPFMR